MPWLLPEHFNAVMAVEATAFGIGNAFIRLQSDLFPRAASLPIARSGETSAGWNRSRSAIKGQQFFIRHAGKRIREV